MKKTLITLTLLAAQTQTHAQSCDVDKDEALVCAVILCTVGLTVPAARDECLQVQVDYLKYLATLGLFDKPPKCYQRDAQCNRHGRGSAAPIDQRFCDSLLEDDASAIDKTNHREYQACIAALAANA